MGHHPILMGIGSYMAAGLVSNAIYQALGQVSPQTKEAPALSAVLGGVATVAIGWKFFPDYTTSIGVGSLLGCSSPLTVKAIEDFKKEHPMTPPAPKVAGLMDHDPLYNLMKLQKAKSKAKTRA